MVTMVWVVSRFRLKAPPCISSSCISPLTSSEQRSRASWASQPQKSATLTPQPGGKPRKFIRTCGGIGRKKIVQIDVTQDRQRMYKRNSEVCTTNNCYYGKAISITYSECVFVALVIQHATRTPRIILIYVACLALSCFSALSHKRHDFRGGDAGWGGRSY